MKADPGWGPVGRNLPFAVIPHLAVWASKRRRLDGLSGLRLLYVSLLVSLAWVLAAVLLLDHSGDGTISTLVALLLVAGFAAVSYAGLLILRGSLIEAKDSAHAADIYRSRMLLTLAFTMAVPLIGFVFVFIARDPSPYYLGLGLAIPGFYLAAPTRGAVARHQARLEEPIDLLTGLVAEAPSMAGSQS